MSERPNILLLLADSFQQHVLGCSGGRAPTPHVDRSPGRDPVHPSFCAAPMCAPARSVIDTELSRTRTG